MATNIIYLLIPFMSPVVFFLAAQITYDFGVLGLLGYAFGWTASFILIYFTRGKIASWKKDEFLKGVVKELYRLEVIVSVFLVIKIIITETLFEYLTFINLVIIVLIFIAIVFLEKVNKNFVSIGTILLGITLSFLLPTLVYLKVSIPTVYSGVHFLSTELLRLDDSATWIMIGSLGIIIATHQHLYQLIDSHSIKHNRMSSFWIASVIAGIVTISFGTISFLGRAQAVLPNLSDRVSIQVIYRFGGQFGPFVFIAITAFISFFVLGKIWKSITLDVKNKKAIVPSFIKYFIAPVLVVGYIDFTLFDVFLVFGLIWGPLLSTFIIPSMNQVVKRGTVGIGIIMGLVASLSLGIAWGVIIGAMSTAIILLAIYLIELYRSKYLSRTI